MVPRLNPNGNESILMAPPEPPFLRPVPPSQPRPASSPESAADPATLALHGQLIDPATSTRGNVDPLAHLDTPSPSPLQQGAVPLTPRRGPAAGDDDLSDLFTDRPENSDGPSL